MISDLQHHSGNLKGFVGTIQEAGHEFDRLWVGLCVRDSHLSESTKGDLFFDLTSTLGKYNILIGREKPTFKIDYDKPMAQWMHLNRYPVVRGFGYVAESVISLEEIYATATA